MRVCLLFSIFLLTACTDVNFTSIPSSKDVACSELSDGKYLLETCLPSRTHKCLGQKYLDKVCYTRPHRKCSEGGYYSSLSECTSTSSHKCESISFGQITCVDLVSKTCSDFDLYADLASCNSSKPDTHACKLIKKTDDVSCYFTEVDQSLYVSEEFMQPLNERRKVDVLFVNDNSVSMYEDQVKMGEKLNSFIDGLSDVDWHIGITTTDLSSGPYSTNGALLEMEDGTRFITELTENKEDLFKNTMTRQESQDCLDRKNKNCRGLPSGEEKPLKAIIEAINLKDTVNSGFFRDEADLAVVILTDEDEFVPEENPELQTTPQDVIDEIEQTWNEKRISVYGVVIEDGDQACFEEQQNAIEDQFIVNYALVVTELVQKTEGITGSICAADYGESLRSIGQNIVRLIDKVDLTYLPAPGTLSVRIKNTTTQRRLTGSEYSLEGQTVRLLTRVLPGTAIEVTYIPQK